MTRKNIILIVVAAVVVIAGGATAVTLLGLHTPPDPETAKPEEVTKFLASDQFARMPVEKKQKYMEKLHKNPNRDRRQMRQMHQNLSKKEQEKLHENMGSMFMARMQQDVNKYFELPEDQRTAYLDEMIDRHEKMRQEWQAHRSDRGNNPPGDGQRRGGPGRGRGHWSPERRKQMLKHISGEQRARFMAYREAMRKRRQERGLPEPRGPGRH